MLLKINTRVRTLADEIREGLYGGPGSGPHGGGTGAKEPEQHLPYIKHGVAGETHQHKVTLNGQTYTYNHSHAPGTHAPRP
jgi:hypothetical protein